VYRTTATRSSTLRQLAKEGETSITARETFRQLHLNVWLDHSTSPFVEMAIYDKGDRPIPGRRAGFQDSGCSALDKNVRP